MSISLINPCSISSRTLVFNPLFQSPLAIAKHNHVGCSFPRINLRTCQRSGALLSSNKKSRSLVVCATPETGDVISSAIPFLPSGENSWINWALGFGLTVPLITARLLTLTKQVSVAAETVERVADTVGKVADEVDKAAEEFAEKLPEGGMLRGIVESIEHLAEETEKDAQLVENLMDKVEEVNQKVEAFISHDEVKETVKIPNSNDGKKQ